MFNWFSPKIFNQGYLPEKDGHKVFFMEAGNPKGQPVLIFHGGPGGMAKLHHAEIFDRKKFRIIMFDQRGCGRSFPNGEIHNNATANLLDDALRLLDFLKIDRKIILRGASWGSTLALLLAEKYPEKVQYLLLSQIFLADADTAKWMDESSGWFYPDMMEILQKTCKSKNITKSFAKMITSDKLADQVNTVLTYGGYERVLGQMFPKFPEMQVRQEDIDSVKIYANYAAAEFMLEPNFILNHIEPIKHIPTLIVHNRLDMVCPLINAWKLHKALSNSKLIVVPEIGHVGKILSKTIKKEISEFLNKAEKFQASIKEEYKQK